MQRATPPATKNSRELPWFRVERNAVDNFTLRNAELYGRGPGDVSFEEQRAYVDFGVLYDPSPKDYTPDEPATYARNLRLENVRFDHFYGVCVFLRHLNGVTMRNVDCIDPTKGGLIFAYGVVDGKVSDIRSTITGDDAMAMTSCHSTNRSICSTTENISVDDALLTMETTEASGAPLAIRGAHDITVTDSFVGPGGGPSSVVISHSTEAAHRYHSQDIRVANSKLRRAVDVDGVRVVDEGASNIQIVENSIDYTPPRCGIRLSSLTPATAVTSSGNTCLGTAQNDQIAGSDLDDLINSRAGEDSVEGRGGLDTLEGRRGPDNLVGDGANDSSLDGEDTMIGNDGPDTLSGEGSNNRYFGGLGQDSIDASHNLANAGTEVVFGGRGNDTIVADDGIYDEIHCGKGADDYVDSDASDIVSDGCETIR
jgi:Ca2+-binding RTX toxin-like protein